MKRVAVVSMAMFVFVGIGVGAQDLTIGLMPAVDSIPILVAQDQGYFTDEGIDVSLQMFRNQLYRETALQTGRIDGSVSDMINALFAWQSGTGTRVASVTDGMFALVTAPGSDLKTIRDWNAAGSVRTGLLENSIIYYVAERMLEAAGGDTTVIDMVTTLQVPARMEMIVAGQIQAGLLPEPVTRIAVAQGASILVDTTAMDQTPGVLLFTERSIAGKEREIEAFFRAYNRAVAALQDDADRFRPAVVRLGEFPPAVENSFVFPEYEPARLPTEEEFDDVVAWMIDRKMLESRPTPQDVLVDGLLPAR